MFIWNVTYIRFDTINTDNPAAVAHEGNPISDTETLPVGNVPILYNILHPTVENSTDFSSEDEQVNGVGIYRTVAGGTSPLLLERIRFATRPEYTLTTPMDLWGMDPSELRPVMSFRVPDFHLGWTYRANSYAWTTSADFAAITAGDVALIEGLGARITHQASDADDSFCTHQWEMEHLNSQTLSETNIPKGTYQWEGMNSLGIVGTTVTSTLPHFAGGTPVRFWAYERFNNSNPPLDPILAGSYTGSVTTAPLDTFSEVFVTQIWERDLELFWQDTPGASILATPSTTNVQRNPTGAINSEDSRGYHATHRWEIDFYDIKQTFYWAYLDDTADNALGEAVEDDNNVPPPGDILSIFQEHAFLAGDPANPHYLYWSKRFRPEAWPLNNYTEIGTANDPIRAHMPIAGVLGVFTTQTKYRVSGNDTNGFIHDEAISHRGAPSPRSVVPTDKGVLFVARDGVFSTNFIGPDQKISDAIDPIFLGETKNGYSPINWDQAGIISAGFYKNKFYFSYPSGVSTTNDMTAVYSFDTNMWTFWDIGFNSFYAERDTDLFLAGGGDSLVYVIEDFNSTDDDGASIAFELETRDFVGAAHTTRNLFTHFKVDANCSDGEMTAAFYVDDVLIASRAVTGDRECDLLSLPENTFGHHWRIRVSYTGNRRVAVYGVSSIFIPLMAA